MNKLLKETKTYLLYFKYNFLLFKRNFLFKPKDIGVVEKFKKKNKIVICGNGPSYNTFEKEHINGQYREYDILMLNYGALETKLKINFHVFELPRSKKKSLDYINKLENTSSDVCKIFRPRTNEHLSQIKKRKLQNIYILKEKRIRQQNSTVLYKDLKQFKSNNVLFCRSSIVYATLFALRLGYKEILYTGINPNINTSWCSNAHGSKEYHINRATNNNEVHATFKKVGGSNSYDVLKLISNFKLFKKNIFKIDSNSYDFLS
jgi:hypothetical protein